MKIILKLTLLAIDVKFIFALMDAFLISIIGSQA